MWYYIIVIKIREVIKMKTLTKEDKVFNYLMENIKIDMDTIARIMEQPKEAIELYGGVRNWYLFSCPHYSECEQAIKYADYKHPDSNETWEKVEEIKDLVVRMKLFSFKCLEEEKPTVNISYR